jgi:hypothetical protein
MKEESESKIIKFKNRTIVDKFKFYLEMDYMNSPDLDSILKSLEKEIVDSNGNTLTGTAWKVNAEKDIILYFLIISEARVYHTDFFEVACLWIKHDNKDNVTAVKSGYTDSSELEIVNGQHILKRHNVICTKISLEEFKELWRSCKFLASKVV